MRRSCDSGAFETASTASTRNGKVVVFYQSASKFKTRYGTSGFSEDAWLDDGVFWPAAYAMLEVTATVEKELRSLVKRVAG